MSTPNLEELFDQLAALKRRKVEAHDAEIASGGNRDYGATRRIDLEIEAIGQVIQNEINLGNRRASEASATANAAAAKVNESLLVLHGDIGRFFTEAKDRDDAMRRTFEEGFRLIAAALKGTSR